MIIHIVKFIRSWAIAHKAHYKKWNGVLVKMNPFMKDDNTFPID